MENPGWDLTTPSGAVLVAKKLIKLGELAIVGYPLRLKLIILDMQDCDMILGVDYSHH